MTPNNKDDDRRAQDNVVPDPKADPAERERKSLVDELLATLTPKQAEAIRLYGLTGIRRKLPPNCSRCHQLPFANESRMGSTG